MLYLLVKLIHLFSVLIYGGFLFTDNLILMRMQKNIVRTKISRGALLLQRLYESSCTKSSNNSRIEWFIPFLCQFWRYPTQSGLTNFQILLLIKAYLGSWLGLRGVLQVFFNVQPFIFKSHKLPFILIIIIVVLSQVMWYV